MNYEIMPYEENIVLFESEVKGIQITDQAGLSKAAALIVAGKAVEDKIKSYFAPLKKDAHKAWRTICDRENLELSRIVPTIERLNRAAADYRFEQERRRKEAEEESRIAALKKKQLEEEALKKATIAETKGDKAMADAILNKAAEEETKIAPAPFIPDRPETEGLSMRENWDFEITDEALIPRAYLMPNEVLIRKTVKTCKDKLIIPGIRVFNKPIMVRS